MENLPPITSVKPKRKNTMDDNMYTWTRSIENSSAHHYWGSKKGYNSPSSSTKMKYACTKQNFCLLCSFFFLGINCLLIRSIDWLLTKFSSLSQVIATLISANNIQQPLTETLLLFPKSWIRLLKLHNASKTKFKRTYRITTLRSRLV